MKQHRGDVAFYGLLLCVAMLAIALSLVPLRQRAPSAPQPPGGTTVFGTPPSGTRGSGAPSSGPLGAPKTGKRHARSRHERHAPVVTVAAVRGPSWLVIRSRYAGRVLYRGLLEQGQRVRVRGRALWAQIGAAGNVDVRVRRRLVRLGGAATTGVILTAQGAVATQPGFGGVLGS